MQIKKYIIISLIIFCTYFFNKIYAQCFASPGNPIAGSTNLGVLDKGIIRTVSFYQYSLLNKYMEGSSVIDYNLSSAVSSANYNYAGFSIGYGITNKFTIETEMGYFINKTQNFKYIDFTERGYGLSNAIISGKYNLYKNLIKGVEFSFAAGAKIPFSIKPQIVDGVQLSIDAQPSTGNFGGVLQTFFVKEFDIISARIILINRYETNFTESKQGYKFGDAFTSSLFLSKHLANPYTRLTKDITAIIQLRHEYVMPYYENGKLADYKSGNNSVYISPQINYNLNLIWNFSLMYDIPVYQYYNGIQLAHSYAITFSITKDFGFGI